jgi:regulatory protein
MTAHSGFSKNAVDEAVKLLSRKAYSEKNLTDKLVTAGFDRTEVAECLRSLKNWHYINDREFGINRIKQLQARLKSRAYVSLDLENIGLLKDLVEELLNSYYPEDQELRIAQELLQKKANSQVNSRKMWAFLVRAGFSENTVHHCFPGIDPT